MTFLFGNNKFNFQVRLAIRLMVDLFNKWKNQFYIPFHDFMFFSFLFILQWKSIFCIYIFSNLFSAFDKTKQRLWTHNRNFHNHTHFMLFIAMRPETSNSVWNLHAHLDEKIWNFLPVFLRTKIIISSFQSKQEPCLPGGFLSDKNLRVKVKK